MSSSREIRKAFLDYFQSRGHTVVPSSPIVPPNDPTLMFTNAGMVQFKDVFTGKDRRDYKRAASSQKCIRISGKHNDLENVGVTARHQTFFEMLGNFSFGDYFKEDAIKYAWELLTTVMEIPANKLVVTVFEGAEGIPADEEAAKIWADISGLPPERIVRLGLADNFWAMGDTGPCGPCSEIHYFVGEGDADPARFGEEPKIDGTGWTEIWNNVFMQFERDAAGNLTPLPAQSVDTGMGLERLATVKQRVRSNYDTDLLRGVVDLAAQLSKKPYGGSLSEDDISMRVIADHARTTAFLIAEGIFPDRDGREYVLRRVMRRAVRHGHRLGIDRPFLHEAAMKVVETMGEVYPELRERAALIEDITRMEEERFRATLKRGLDLIAENDDWEGAEEKKTLPGRVAFKLFDTFGFPLDLQAVIGREQGFAIDEAGFDREMAQARERSAGSKVGEQALDAMFHALKGELPPVEFLGYERERAESDIVAIAKKGDGNVGQLGKAEHTLREGDEGYIVTRATPFYAESGGQVGDTGTIETGNGLFTVEDTQRPLEGFVIHHGRVKQGTLSIGDAVTMHVDGDRRRATRRNHSATHLLHYALRKVLGPQAMQKGSLVGPDRLRFDYSSSRPLEPNEIRRIEDLVNEKILANAPIETEVLPMEDAKRKGAIGIFEEKYGAVVRMLRMTEDSIELCGGTHAARTGDLGFFKVLSESGLAAGVRRIEAATGWNALEVVRSMESEIEQTASLLKAPAPQLREKVERLVAAQRELTKEVEDLKRKLVSGGSQDLTANAKDINGVRVLGTTVELGDPKTLRELADKLRDKLAPAVILLGTKAKDGKALLVCSVSKEVTERFPAGGIIREVAAIVGGGGGGRPDFAQAGGSDASKLNEAVAKVYELVSR